jgi:cell migration-inducing and hyaluronan-binding protein
VREAPNYDPPVPANFTHFLSYKNRRRGVWLRGTHLQLTQSLIADNSIGITFAGANDELLDSLVVGQTQNDTGPPKPFDPAFPLRGFEFYDGRVDVRDTTFENFLPNASRKASALSALQYTPFFTDPTNYAQHVTFIRSQPVYFTLHAGARDKLGADGYRSTVFVDTDGSVTGSPDASVVYDSPFLDDPDCKAVPQWNARVCNAQYASLFIVAPSSTKYVRVAQASRYAYITLYGNPDRYARATFQTDVRADGAYIVTLSRASGTIEIAAHHLAKNATVTVYLPQAQEPAQRRLQLRDGERYRATVTSPRTGASL